MISQLRGEVIEASGGLVTIDVNGVGYEVLVSEIDLEKIVAGEDIRIHTYFHVRETAQELFGFLEKNPPMMRHLHMQNNKKLHHFSITAAR